MNLRLESSLISQSPSLNQLLHSLSFSDPSSENTASPGSLITPGGDNNNNNSGGGGVNGGKRVISHLSPQDVILKCIQDDSNVILSK